MRPLTTAIAIAIVAALGLLGCPSDDPFDETADTVANDHGPPDAAGTDDPDPGPGDDGAPPVDPGGGTGPEPDEGPPNDPGPPPDGCKSDADCVDELGALGPCQVPLCEDGSCFADAVPSGIPCDDDEPCTQNDICQGGICGGSPLSCNDGNDCTTDECEGGQCAHVALDGVACTDGDPCTGPDLCKAGSCKAPPGECPACESDADCAPFDDDDLCNGELACENGACVTEPTSVIDCSTIPTGPCKVAECVPSVGACATVEKPDASQCEPDSPCVELGFCAAGECKGVPIQCNDDNPCTADGCDPDLGCLYTPMDGGACDDGSGCTTDDVCTGGACQGVPKIDCNDGNPCTLDACDEITGACVFTPNESPCDDGNPCTQKDQCQEGECVGEGTECDDDDECTTDSCDPDGGCVYAALECDDGDPCTTDGCEPGFGCNSLLPGKPCLTVENCVDPKACTQEACNSCGFCEVSPVDCDDGNPCTADTCAEPGGCQNTPKTGEPCDDSEPCTTDDTCSAGSVCSGTPVDGPACQCAGKPDGSPCSDGDLCTGPDLCAAGACVPGIKDCPPGTEENPAVSCQAIKAASATAPSGPYWMKGAGGPFETWCEMTTQGGGWTRVANLALGTPICSLATPMGAASGLAAAKPSETIILPPAMVDALPFGKQLLVTTSAGHYVFQSTHPQFIWSNVATGAINQKTVDKYAVHGAPNGGTPAPLQSVTPGGKGPHLMGGNQVTGGTSPYLGIGGFHSATFDQATCSSPHTAIYSGNISSPGWNTAAIIYLR